MCVCFFFFSRFVVRVFCLQQITGLQEFPFMFASTYRPCDAAYQQAFDIN